MPHIYKVFIDFCMYLIIKKTRALFIHLVITSNQHLKINVIKVILCNSLLSLCLCSMFILIKLMRVFNKKRLVVLNNILYTE